MTNKTNKKVFSYLLAAICAIISLLILGIFLSMLIMVANS
jgi:hypothetical protein